MKRLTSKWITVALIAGVLPFTVACGQRKGSSNTSSVSNCAETVAKAFNVSSQAMMANSLAGRVTIQSADRDTANRVLAVNLTDRQYGYGQFYVAFDGPVYGSGYVNDYRNYDVSYRCLDSSCNQIAVLVEDYGQNMANPTGAVMQLSSSNKYYPSCVTGA